MANAENHLLTDTQLASYRDFLAGTPPSGKKRSLSVLLANGGNYVVEDISALDGVTVLTIADDDHLAVITRQVVGVRTRELEA